MGRPSRWYKFVRPSRWYKFARPSRWYKIARQYGDWGRILAVVEVRAKLAAKYS